MRFRIVVAQADDDSAWEKPIKEESVDTLTRLIVLIVVIVIVLALAFWLSRRSKRRESNRATVIRETNAAGVAVTVKCSSCGFVISGEKASSGSWTFSSVKSRLTALADGQEICPRCKKRLVRARP